VEYPLVEVVKHADQQCIEEVGLQKVTHDTGNMLKHVESSVKMAGLEITMGSLAVGNAENSM
jgi:hypothetical protein